MNKSGKSNIFMDARAPSSVTLDTPDDPHPIMPRVRSMPVPHVRILYHVDLKRVGEVTEPGLFIDAPEGVIFGRNAPDFQDPRHESARHRPLQDPFVSRRQLWLRWSQEHNAFEVRPRAGARRKLTQIDIATESTSLRQTDVPDGAFLPPGSLLAIGQRVLLLLCHAPWRPHISDRMGLVGETEAVWRLREDIAAMARFKRPALVLGETGAGKELVARALCAQSTRATAPFIALNCAALPEHLVESELFGHARGAFTGATHHKKGLFIKAHQGTLFLDEFGELPMSIQAKLLRVLQDGLVTPVGSHESESVDVRLIAATNRDPKAEIENGQMRKDLYYRISSHIVQVPTLAKRRWDVPLLFAHFLSKTCVEHPELVWLMGGNLNSTGAIPMSFVTDLLRHQWPGNIRELQNIVEQTARLNLQPGPFRRPSGLWTNRPDMTPLPAAPAPLHRVESHAVPSGEQQTARLNMASIEIGVAPQTVMKLLLPRDHDDPHLEHPDFQQYVERLRARLAQNLFDLMATHNFHQSQTAAYLNVSRTTLGRLMECFGLPRPQDLPLETLRQAWRDTAGDITQMAQRLRVSPRALRLHLTRNNLIVRFKSSPR